ncbi:MAG TPA: hypothetical protein VIX17_05065 [Pyrinomonadaceae bacterium]|jgi:hypothetical protein
MSTRQGIGKTQPAYLQTHPLYDLCGNLQKTWDSRDTGLGIPSQIAYSNTFSDGVPRNTYALATSITTAVPDLNGTYGSNWPALTKRCQAIALQVEDKPPR